MQSHPYTQEKETVLPSLKPDVEKALRSRVVYQKNMFKLFSFLCRSNRSTFDDLFQGVNILPSKPVEKHLRKRGVQLSFNIKDSVCVIQFNANSITFPMAQEALWQQEIKPSIKLPALN